MNTKLRIKNIDIVPIRKKSSLSLSNFIHSKEQKETDEVEMTQRLDRNETG